MNTTGDTCIKDNYTLIRAQRHSSSKWTYQDEKLNMMQILLPDKILLKPKLKMKLIM